VEEDVRGIGIPGYRRGPEEEVAVPRLNPDQRRRAQRLARAKEITCQRCGSAYLLCSSTLRSYLGGGFSLDLWCQNQVAHSLGHGAPTLFNISPEEGRSIGL
jgi:hypothetical protein